MEFPTFKKELESLRQGFIYVAGCDEVGVGPLAGPVVAAACILDPAKIHGYRSSSKWFYRVRDSKTTSEEEREELVELIRNNCVAQGIGEVAPEVIDEINIHRASLLAMKRAVENMLQNFETTADAKLKLFLDGRFVISDLACGPALYIEQQAIVDGDAQVLSISAASIIAKVHRDGILRDLDTKYPQFGFAKHKGYNTKQHQQAIYEHGITPSHRKSFLKNFAGAVN